MQSNLLKSAVPVVLAIAIAVVAVSVDLHNDEPQAAALVLVVGGFLLGTISPDRAWRWAVILGLSIVIGDPIGVQLGVNPPWPERGFNPGSLFALVPAFIGTYAGVAVRTALRKCSGERVGPCNVLGVSGARQSDTPRQQPHHPHWCV